MRACDDGLGLSSGDHEKQNKEASNEAQKTRRRGKK